MGPTESAPPPVQPVQPASWEGAPPDTNVVLISVDTTRYDHLSLYGYERETSPNLDRLSAGGLVFESAIAQAPATYRSVASLLTGVYPWVFDEDRRRRGDSGPYLPDGIRTLAEELRDGGYETHAIVTNDYLNQTNGFSQGFMTYEDSVTMQEDPAAGTIAERALKRLDSISQPFFLWLHFLEPHHPYSPSAPASWEKSHASDFQDLDDRFSRAPFDTITENIRGVPTLEGGPRERALEYLEGRYDAEILEFDRQLGRVVGALQARGFDDQNTLLVVLADHGEEFDDHGGMLHSHTLYDELIRVPLVIRGKGVAAGRIDSQVQLVDLSPTILDWLGFSAPKRHGESFAAWLRQPPRLEAHRPAISVRSERYISIRTPEAKLVVAYNPYFLSAASWLPWRGLSEMIRTSVFERRRTEIGFWKLTPAHHEEDERLPMSSAHALELYEWLQNERSISVALDDSEITARGLSPDEKARLRALGYAE